MENAEQEESNFYHQWWRFRLSKFCTAGFVKVIHLPFISPHNLINFPQLLHFAQPNMKLCSFCQFFGSSETQEKWQTADTNIAKAGRRKETPKDMWITALLKEKEFRFVSVFVHSCRCWSFTDDRMCTQSEAQITVKAGKQLHGKRGLTDP